MAANELFFTTLFTDANLLAYYRFNSGALTTDDSGNGVTLTNNNTVGEASGKFGIAADGGATNTDKYLSTTTQLLNGGTCTFSCWVKMNTEIAAGSQYFIFQESTGTSHVVFRLLYEYNSGTRRINFSRIKAGLSDQQFYSNVTLGTTNWYHLVLTYNGTTLIGYINGSPVGSVGASGNGIANFSAGGHSLFVSPSLASFGSCLIDDVAIFDRALTATEISNLYNGLTPLRPSSNWFNFF